MSREQHQSPAEQVFCELCKIIQKRVSVRVHHVSSQQNFMFFLSITHTLTHMPSHNQLYEFHCFIISSLLCNLLHHQSLYYLPSAFICQQLSLWTVSVWPAGCTHTHTRHLGLVSYLSSTQAPAGALKTTKTACFWIACCSNTTLDSLLTLFLRRCLCREQMSKSSAPCSCWGQVLLH